MADVIVTALATIAGALVGGLVPVFAARRQARLDLANSAFARVFEEYSRFLESDPPYNPLPLAGAIEQARMLCGGRRDRECDAALEALEKSATRKPPDLNACGKSLGDFRAAARVRLKRLL